MSWNVTHHNVEAVHYWLWSTFSFQVNSRWQMPRVDGFPVKSWNVQDVSAVIQDGIPGVENKACEDHNKALLCISKQSLGYNTQSIGQ